MLKDVSKRYQAIVIAAALVLTLGVTLISLFTSPLPAQAKDSAGNFVIAIDPGHGGGEAGASGIYENEAVTNMKIAKALAAELNEYYGVSAVLTHDGTSGELNRKQRVDRAVAAGADVLISVHCNAGGGTGAEVWIPNTAAYRYELHTQGEALGKSILSKLCAATGLGNRGTKMRSYDDPDSSEYYPSPGGVYDYYGITQYARKAGIVGIIIEHAFVDRASDAVKLRDNWQAMAIADAEGIAAYYGLSKTAPANTSTGEAVETEAVSAYESDPAVMGTAKATAAEMAAWYSSKGKSYPSSTYSSRGAATIEEFAQACIDQGAKEGVRGDIIFVQAMLETGWLGFSGSSVKAEYCNFGGIGATDTNPNANQFSSVQEGLLAQAQHLKGYASTADLNETCVDPRFKYLSSKRGIAPTLSKFGSGVWASDTEYGTKLTKLLNELCGNSENTTATTSVKFKLDGAPSDLTSVFVDGVEQQITVSNDYATVEIEGTGAHSIAAYVMEGDGNTSKMTKMYTWFVSYANGKFTATRYLGLDDFFSYQGVAVRLTDVTGIRITTGMPLAEKTVLAGSGMNGFKLQETGTIMALESNVNEDLTFNTSGAKSSAAYVRNKQNIVRSTSDGVQKFATSFVGFSNATQYKTNVVVRAYAKLTDPSGSTFTIYSGQIKRSVYSVCEQYKGFSDLTSAEKNFVNSIMTACGEETID